jgi:FG-GAP-like repeat
MHKKVLVLLAALGACGGEGISSHPTSDMAAANCGPQTQGNTPPIPTSALAFSYADGAQFAAGNNVVALALADLNNDHKLDVIASDYGIAGMNGGLAVLLGNGDGTLGAAHTVAAGDAPSSVAAADFDGDGKLDLVVTNDVVAGETTVDGTQVSVLIGHGDGTFAAPVQYTVGSRPHAVVALDLNHDCQIDLAVADTTSDDVSILLGHGDGTFGAPTAMAIGQWPWSLAATDLDGDGNADLVVADFQDGNLSVLKGHGDGSFAVSAVAVGAAQDFVAVADLDGDGKPEAITAAANYVDRISIFANDGRGALQAPTGLVTTSVPWWLAVGDLDRDGRPDIVVAESNGSTSPSGVDVLLNSATGLQSPAAIATTDWSQAVELGDLNGDGLPDIVVAGPTSVSVFLNTSK